MIGNKFKMSRIYKSSKKRETYSGLNLTKCAYLIQNTNKINQRKHK